MSSSSSSMSYPRLDLSELQALLTTRRLGKAPGWVNELWDSIDSTNNRAAELAEQGASEGVIVIARRQEAGRGRQGRAWISPPEAGLYASFLLRPAAPRAELPLFALACGVAAARAILDCAGLRVGLKWVNDLVIDGKKLGGILAEIPSHTPSDRSLAQGAETVPLVVGIGINLRLAPEEIPVDLRDRVDWLERWSAQPIDPNLLLASLAKHLELAYDALSSGQSQEILTAWREFSVTLGRRIRAVSGTAVVEGTAVDIGESGGLIVERDDGNRVVLHAGEITIRGADGSYI